jgi:hypothetical protein
MKTAVCGALLALVLCGQTFAQRKPNLAGTWRNQYTPNLSDALGHEPP